MNDTEIKIGDRIKILSGMLNGAIGVVVYRVRAGEWCVQIGGGQNIIRFSEKLIKYLDNV